MWTFGSERALARAAYGAVAALAGTAILFYWLQNQYRPVGGDISWPKLFWLAYAILLWFILPALLAADRRLAPEWRKPFLVLALLMFARGVVEGWMLYVSLNWSPWYGIFHDAACALVLGFHAFALVPGPRNPLERLMLAHLVITALMFAPEVYFAWYMQANFNTQGESAIYFVPDDVRYADVLRVTTGVVLFLTAYFPFFLFHWLHGTPRSNRHAAS